MKNRETNTPGNSLATSEFRLLRHHQIALEGVLRLQREVEQKADSAAGHDVPEHFCSPRAEPVCHRTQRQNAADGEEHARAVKLRAARPKRVFYPEAKRLFSGTMLPSEGEAPVFRKKAACLQEPLFPLEESRFFSPPFFAPATARATSREMSLSGCFSRLEPLRSCSSRKKRSACFPESNSLFSGTALPAGGKPLLLAALFRAGDGEGDEPGEVVVVGLLFPAGAAQEPLFPPEESRFFSPSFFAPATARAMSRARSPSGCFSRLEPLKNHSSRRRKAASSRFPSSRR